MSASPKTGEDGGISDFENVLIDLSLSSSLGQRPKTLDEISYRSEMHIMLSWGSLIMAVIEVVAPV